MFVMQVVTSKDLIEKITLIASNKTYVDTHHPEIKKKLEAWLDCYSTKKQPKIALPLDLSKLSPFSKKVLEALQMISFGQTKTYAQIAQKIGCRAFRAVGNACHDNPFPIIIPCHRVVAKTHLGGFAYGKEFKRALLKFET
ncbi:MAG: Methylated-DNA--protein-cysteine methyltransferase, constitutive [Chlamydiae bacterium]|nr:Methylated-DNA--protein-cysteine methyltransferase, constitutive [Chlamydiota bacterium]